MKTEKQAAFILPLLAMLVLTGSGAPATAQTSSTPQSSANHSTVLLSEGTPVHLALGQSVSSKSAVVGQIVELVLREDLKVGEAVVARHGTRVLGTVVAGKTSEKRGIAREIKVRFDAVRVGDARIKLRGEQSASSRRNKGEIVAASIAFGLSGYLLTSAPKNMVIPEGTPVEGFVDESIELPILR